MVMKRLVCGDCMNVQCTSCKLKPFYCTDGGGGRRGRERNTEVRKKEFQPFLFHYKWRQFLLAREAPTVVSARQGVATPPLMCWIWKHKKHDWDTAVIWEHKAWHMTGTLWAHMAWHMTRTLMWSGSTWQDTWLGHWCDLGTLKLQMDMVMLMYSHH